MGKKGQYNHKLYNKQNDTVMDNDLCMDGLRLGQAKSEGWGKVAQKL